MENYLGEAKRNDPEGSICSFCGNPNDFADDCGWFYLHPLGSDNLGGYSCRQCFDGEPGKKHIAIYGLGER